MDSVLVDQDFPTAQRLETNNMPSISRNSIPNPMMSEILYYDSDDSVKDKDYHQPFDEVCSDDTEYGYDMQRQNTVSNPKSKPIVKKTSITKTFPKKLITRRHTHEFTRTEEIIGHQLPKKRRTSLSIIDCSISTDLVNLAPPSSTKRKKYDTSMKDRLVQKEQERRSKYNVKTGCDMKCTKCCTITLTPEERLDINNKYWMMTHSERRLFIRSNYTVAVPKRKYVQEPKRNAKREFTLQNSGGVLVKVCKVFFLTTLGYCKTNDKILVNSLNPDKDVDKRGMHVKTPAFNRDLITEHIESFNPAAPHYRREHAPHRRYLPSEINITFMYSDFCSKFPENKVSYELYRSHLKSLNISFARLGNEECEICESYRLHGLDTNHNVRTQAIPDCNACSTWAKHHDKYKKARELYDLHKTLEQNTQHIYFSSDLEKVIMLPRLDTFKSVIFCPRLTVYNQTFAPVGKITRDVKPLAAIWHDGIAGRKQDDIMSCYYSFLLKFRDIQSIHLWLDNCTSQNKNWLLFSMLIDLINSDLIATKTITLFYFEPGHTFMSCDQFHHQVELSMKRKKSIYDFTDFEDAVASANNGKVLVKSMQPQDFVNYVGNVSDRRIQNSSPRAYLKNMTQVCFKRGSFDLHYKEDFDQEYMSLKFLNDKYLKNQRLVLTFRTQPKGIDEERKLNLITKLSPIIPKHKMLFWQNVPIIDEGNNTSELNQKKNKRNVTLVTD